MAYSSRDGRRPMEAASKIAHRHIVQDESVRAFLDACEVPIPPDELDLAGTSRSSFVALTDNPIQSFVAIDGGFQEVIIHARFPSSVVCFFQFGALFFQRKDLEDLTASPFIDPEDMARLKQMQRLKLVLPIRNYALKTEATLTHSVRRALYDFFRLQPEDDHKLIETLRWLLFEEYRSPQDRPITYVLSNCPHCRTPRVSLERARMTSAYTWKCPYCANEIQLTDTFRLHEAIDDEIGAGGILAYVMTGVEQILLVHIIRLMLQQQPRLLKEVMFIKDGPLAFFGQTARLHEPMLRLNAFLQEHHALYLAGLEKSGAFVEHAAEIDQLLEPGTVLPLDNAYIYRYVLPGNAGEDNLYGRTSYYGQKLLFKSPDSATYVVTVPVPHLHANPTIKNLPGLDVILTNLTMLRCDMYDNALLPIALANKMVSLSNHPSSKILQRFSQGKSPQ